MRDAITLAAFCGALYAAPWVIPHLASLLP